MYLAALDILCFYPANDGKLSPSGTSHSFIYLVDLKGGERERERSFHLVGDTVSQYTHRSTAWVSGIWFLEPSLLSPQLSMSTDLELGTKLGL